ncbi:MAG TPA: Maf family protein [Terriglobales bacterium]|nr:Maf family protein [Terriglobales bacterium]
MSPPARLVLASASPRRRELLEAAGFEVEVRPAPLDETPLPGEAAADYVLRLARAKARALAAPGLVLGADTVVVVDGDLLGKPASDAEAAAMLARLAGREHQVLTGVCLRDPARNREAARAETTRVWFAPLSPQEIADYVQSGEPRDKAGAYAIQGRAARFIPRIEGSYSNVVGLPLATVWDLWRQLAG